MLRSRICVPTLLAVALLFCGISPATAADRADSSLSSNLLEPTLLSTVLPGTLDLFLSPDHFSISGLPRGPLISGLCGVIPPDNGDDEECRLLASNGGGSGRLGSPFEITVEDMVVLPAQGLAAIGVSFSAFSVNHDEPFVSNCPTDITTWIELDPTALQPISTLTLIVDGIDEGSFFGTVEIDVLVSGQLNLVPESLALSSPTGGGSGGGGGGGGGGMAGQLRTTLTFDFGGRWLLEPPTSLGTTNLVLFADRDIEGAVDGRPACASGKKSCGVICLTPTPPASTN